MKSTRDIIVAANIQACIGGRLVASAGEFKATFKGGGIDPVLEDVADIGGAKLKLPKVNVHAFRYDKGRHTLEMIGKGSYVILGVAPANVSSKTLTDSD